VDREEAQLARGWRSERDGQWRRRPLRRVMEKTVGAAGEKRVAVEAGRASGGGVRGEGGRSRGRTCGGGGRT
jgi:hypothetical protein